MRRTLFISDLHLDEARRHVTEAFFDFLDKQASGCDALYILGDFFEAWVGDDDHSPLNQEVIAALAKCTVKGLPIYVMHGNRDFLLGEAFCRASGCQFLPDPSVIGLYGQPILLMHGDSLCTRDTDYMAFREKIRDPHMQRQLLGKPLAERHEIAKQLRSESNSAQSNKAEDIMDVTPEEVAMQMQKHGVRRLIHGHTHRPAVHAIKISDEDAQRIVLGDWEKALWYVDARPDQLELLSQPIGNRQW